MPGVLRHGLQQTGLGAEPDFHWRGGEVSRIEGFSDAVFAFALTLLVVSLEVPRSYSELMHVMQGFLGFAICFAILLMVWYEHYLYFRRYGLQDMFSLVLNAVLLFLVLFYVYPLKFLFSMVAAGLWSIFGSSPREMGAPTLSGGAEVTGLFLIYNAGYIAVFGVFALLYHHVMKRRRELELTPGELLHTREKLCSFYANMGVAVLSTTIVVMHVPKSLAGLVYFLIGPARAFIGSYFGKQRRLLQTGAERPPEGGKTLLLVIGVFLAGTSAANEVRGAIRDTAVYPVTGRSAPSVPAPPLLFEKTFETILQGLPAGDSLALSPDQLHLLVRTDSGAYEIDPAAEAEPGSLPVPLQGSAGASAGNVAGRECLWAGDKPPSWLGRVTDPNRPAACVDGPEGIVALLSPDGSIFGRERSNGHLLWRRIASNRVSRPGAALGPYLLVAADAARSLEALRWSDGTTAGWFRLDSDNAYLSSRPVIIGGQVCVLSVRSPRSETRLLCLHPRALAAPAAAGPSSSAPH